MTDEHDRAWVKPPAALVALAAMISAIGIGMIVVGSQSIGVSTDEPGHVRRLNSYLTVGLYTREFESRNTPAGQIPLGAYIYGPVTSIIQHDANRLMGHEDAHRALTRPEDYKTRHAVIGSMAIAGLIATIIIGWAILGDWRWGVISGGLLAATPLWTGHSMFNMKDVPVATAHTLITGALIFLALSRPATKMWLILGYAVALAGGIVLMLGTRPEMWPSLVASLVVFGIVLVRDRRAQTRTSIARHLAVIVASLAAAYVALWAIYPRVYGDLVKALTLSVSTGAQYDGLGDQAPSDRSYLPIHLFTDLPLGLLAFMAAGTAFALVVAFRPRHSVRWDCLALVGSQAFAVMGAAFLFDAVLYQGLRQMLFATPALAILGTCGLAAALTRARTHAFRSAIGVGFALALVLPTAAQAAMFPYQYAYVNVVAGQTGIVGHDGPDYFATSFREYAEKGPQTVKVICPFLRFNGTVERKDADCRTRFAHTFSAYWRGRPTPDHPKNDEFYALLRGSRATPPNCTPFLSVERRVNLQKVTMSHMYKCHDPSPAEVKAGEAMKKRERAVQGWKRGPGGKGWVPAHS